MPLSSLHSVAFFGLEVCSIEIEVDAAFDEKPSFLIVGLPDTAVRESKDRVLSAIRNSYSFNAFFRATINLAPAHLKKEGALFDLPIALGLLSSFSYPSPLISKAIFKDYLILGELGLTGDVRGVKGVLAATLFAKAQGKKGILLPLENIYEVSSVEGIDIIPVKTLKEAVLFFEKGIKQPFEPKENIFLEDVRKGVDFSAIKGQQGAKRALEIAAAGGHNIAFIGPPGSGKTMLAEALPTILPPISLEEALETTTIHSLSGLLKKGETLLKKRPFRSPHHTISFAGLIGGGSHPKPGEISLAHNGVLFLDELPEFSRTVLEMLRQPLEEKKVTISRAMGHLTYPANFMLVAALNPCPCGLLGHPQRRCKDTQREIDRYMGKISAPLWDRIDLQLEVPPVAFSDFQEKEEGEPSVAILKRVLFARNFQKERGQKALSNALLKETELALFSPMKGNIERILKEGMETLHLSARSLSRIRKVGRTIADLEGSVDVQDYHIMEALSYRSPSLQE